MVRIISLLTFMMFILTACMPEQALRRPVSVENNDIANSSDDSNNTNTSTDSSTELDPDNIYWFDNGITSSTLTIDETSQKNIYIFSDFISETILSDSANQVQLCAVIEFQSNINTTPKELRVLLNPQSSFDALTGKTRRFYKVNFSDKDLNENCNLFKYEKNNSTYNAITYVVGDAANTLEDVCPTCLNMITSNSVKIYETSFTSAMGPDAIIRSNGLIKEFDDQRGFDNLILRVDMNNNSSNNSPSCTNSDCQAQGFDCCLSGQCVKDGGLKNTRTEVAQIATDLGDASYLTQFDLAEAQKITNPLSYLQYPQYYYICLENVPNDDNDGPLDPSDPAGDAKRRLKEMISDYYCVEELKEYSLSDPFHTDPWNAASAGSYRVCKAADDPNASPDMFYKDVMERLYKHCGCASDTYNEMVANCPKYTYKPIYNDSNSDYKLTDLYSLLTSQGATSPLDIENLADFTDIVRVECVSPEVDPNILPFADMDVIVNSKTAPHRFFSETTSGVGSVEITDFNDIPDNATGVQEGDSFQYLDDEKVFPLNGSFNMNSILGQMTVDLSQARPATKIDLEFDKMYYIATIEGFYTPCPSCAKDYWFPNFLPNPISTQGVGLQSIGYTTRRDAWGTNTTYGNYEDTIFGRACWLPPTMLPYAQVSNADQKTQRMNRLQTQAAMFVNGYQRDWYGFNKGALIGSFDGVSWFAVGKGRVVKSTTDKLYLAINAPFADLTQYNDHIVSVQEWDFITTAPQYDYHPDENINSVFQNEAGLCQRNHKCETDSDCITQLGWEYSCVDVNQYQTQWPKFTATGAQEIANDSATGTIISFLNQGELPSGTSSKKCVYRGAGAPCRVDYDQIADSGTRKALACAPNFFCASLTSGGVFNTEVARYGNVLENIAESKNHYFGQDANHLGRPKDYISTGNLTALPSAVQTTIDANLTNIDSTGSGNFGLCRPGKSLPSYNGATGTANTDFNEQQKTFDSEYRTDFISQISGCNSGLFTNLRYSSCPMLDSDGNYLHLQDQYVDDAIEIDTILPLNTLWNKNGAAQVYGHSQNSCGLEVLSSSALFGPGISADTINDNSAFSSLEAKPLSDSKVHFEPTLVRDACYRKAGAVCHTDLDCSPNYKHADLIDILNPAFFGNDAEKKYWQEYLVCGQGTPEPMVPSDPDFNTYDITNNRCCREIGKSITMYTEDSPNAPESTGLQTHKFGGYHPNDPARYSRYNNLTSHFIDENTRLPAGSFTRPSANAESSASGNLTNVINILNGKQWKTLNGSAKRTCCGGGWTRKFADGTNNWQVNRFNFDVNNFRCLSFKTPLVNTQDPTPFGLTNTQNNQDSQNYCRDISGTQANCAQLTFGPMDYNQVKPVIDNNPDPMVIDTSWDDNSSGWTDNPWTFLQLMIVDQADPAITYLDWSKEDPNVDADAGAQRRNISVRVPSYITWQSENDTFDSAVQVELELPTDNANEFSTCTPVSVTDYDCGNSGAWAGLCGARTPTNAANDAWATACPANGTDNRNCCYVFDPITRVLKVAHNYGVATNNGATHNLNQDNDHYNKRDLGLKLTYTAPGTLAWEAEKLVGPTVADITSNDSTGQHNVINHRRSATPGNAYYYLRKLEKLELLGVPQIAYEPLYCNDNYQKMVPGIFKSAVNGSPLTNIVEFNTHPDTFLATASTNPSASDVRPYQSDSIPAAFNNLDADSLNEPRLATQELVDHEPIFSDNEFMCCSPLGTEVTQDQVGNCCSGYGEQSDAGGANNPNPKYVCKLAPGTDLNIYFNKFITGEGMSASEESPLTEDDFDDHTGYPKFNETVFQKLKVLAEAHCPGDDGGTYVQGGAFGPFPGEPFGTLGYYGGADSNQVYSIVDSIYDTGSNNDRPAGFDVFNGGQRWNHHIYCDPMAGADGN